MYRNKKFAISLISYFVLTFFIIILHTMNGCFIYIFIKSNVVMNKTNFTPLPNKKSLLIEREFDAPLNRVWDAWTDLDILEKWWAPSPWKAVTKSFEFKDGGHWHYAMTGPEGETHWSMAQFDKIVPNKKFIAVDSFCDENAGINTLLPTTEWIVEFKSEGGKTKIVETLKFVSRDEMDKLTEMGFQEGFSTALDQLESLLMKE